MTFFTRLAEQDPYAAVSETPKKRRKRRRPDQPTEKRFRAGSRRVAEVLADALQSQLDKTLAQADARADAEAESDASGPCPATPPGETSPPEHRDTASSTCSDPLAARYDVRHISSLELSMLGTELYQAGRIERETYAMLSFQPETKSCYDQVGAQGVARPDPNRRRDAIAEWQAILEQQKEFGYSDYFLSQTRSVIHLLEQLDRARRA